MAMVSVGNGRVGSALVLDFRKGDDGLGVGWTKLRAEWLDLGMLWVGVGILSWV